MATNNLLDSLKALAKVLETHDNPSNDELRREAVSPKVNGVGGICGWVGNSPGVDATDRKTLYRLFEAWPEGTGGSLYVIPSELSTVADLGPREAYRYHSFYPFNPDQPYCQARRRLLNWLIEQLEGGSKD